MHQIAKQLDELGITFCTVANGVVTDMELAFKAVQNQQFIKQNSFKCKRGQEQVIASGRSSGSIAFGYDKVLKFDANGDRRGRPCCSNRLGGHPHQSRCQG